MVNNNLKKGFSLVEVLISMLIISVLFAVMSKTMTTKPRQETSSFIHGYYECYEGQDGFLHQKTVSDTVNEDDAIVNECSFKPPRDIGFAVIYATTLDGGIGHNTVVYKHIEPQFNMEINGTNNNNNRSVISQTLREEYNQSGETPYTLEEFRNILQDTYETSGLYQAINANLNGVGGYIDKALFICW